MFTFLGLALAAVIVAAVAFITFAERRRNTAVADYESRKATTPRHVAQMGDSGYSRVSTPRPDVPTTSKRVNHKQASPAQRSSYSYSHADNSSDWLINPLNPLYSASPLNPANQDYSSPSHAYDSHSSSSHCGSSSSSSSDHSSSSSSSYDSGSSSSYDCGSSSSYDSGSSSSGGSDW